MQIFCFFLLGHRLADVALYVIFYKLKIVKPRLQKSVNLQENLEKLLSQILISLLCAKEL